MSTSKSKSKNTTSTVDERSTNTINAGIGGDIDDSLVNSGNYGDTQLSNWVDESNYDSEQTDNSDNSFNLDLLDESNHSQNFDYESVYENEQTDNSDNSFHMQIDDTSDNSTNIDNSQTTITASGAFEMVDSLTGKMIETLGESQLETLEAANELVGRSLDAQATMANRSLTGAMQVKAGQVVNLPESQTRKEMINAGVKVAAVAGVVYLVAKRSSKK